MFDRLMLLAKGKVIYFNEARLAVDYFSGIGFKCPELSNPSDYFMSIMSIETIEQDEIDAVGYHVSVQTVYASKIAKFNENYMNSALKNDEDKADPKAVPISQ